VRSRAKNRVSANSSVATVSVPFAAPTGVRATGAESTMELRWEAVSGAARYEILRLDDYTPEALIGTTTTPSYVDTGLTAGQRYVYWVRAVATNGSTGTSDAIRVYPGAPTTTTVSVSPTQSEDGQRLLFVAHVTYADGRIPSGDVAFMSDGGPVGFASVDGRTGNADLVINGGWTPTAVFAQFQGANWLPAGASASGEVTPAVVPPYGSLAFAGPSWLQVGSWEDGVATGDLTGDGLADIVMTTTEYSDDAHDHAVYLFVQEAGNLLVLRQQAATSTPSGGSMVPVVGDLDGDGVNEALVASGDGIDVFHPDGTGAGLSAPQPLSFGGPVADYRLTDLDGDGRRDLVAMTDSGVVARYGIDGGLTPPMPVSSHRGLVLDVADLSGDGRPDLAVHYGLTVEVSVQTSARSFGVPTAYPVPLGYAPIIGSLATGDVTGDGRADVVVTVSGNSPGARVQVLTRDASGVLGRWIQYPVFEVPDAVVLTDMNHDNRLDVVVAHGGYWRVGVLLQRPDGWLGTEYLTIQLPPASSIAPRGLAAADISNDGSPDLVMANYNYGLVVVPQGMPSTAAATVTGR
jgi:FG-GAP-like repeat/Fibronectin type III domain/FG-GAP repeat